MMTLSARAGVRVSESPTGDVTPTPPDIDGLAEVQWATAAGTGRRLIPAQTTIKYSDRLSDQYESRSSGALRAIMSLT
jgi:hypothetical protein